MKAASGVHAHEYYNKEGQMVATALRCGLKAFCRASVLALVLGSGVAFTQETGQEVTSPSASTYDLMDLSRAWRRALEHDHVYQAAISEQAASQTERAQGRAGLLPRIQAGYYFGKVKGNATQHGSWLGGSGSSRLDYDSSNAYVQLQQPLLNYGRYADYRRGVARAEHGMAVFQSKRQDAGIRLAVAYFNVLLAYEGWTLQRSLESSLAEQLAVIKERYRRHEATRIDAQETEARLAVVRADLIAANDEWTLARRELEALLGEAPTHLAMLRADFPLPMLIPASLQEWLDHASANNAEVQSARQAVRVASAEVDVAASRYAPSTDLVAAYGRAKSENLSSISQKTNTFSVGIQVSIPLFAGGYNRANVSRARSERLQRQHELRAVIEQTQAEVTRHYTNAQTGADHIHALREAVASAQLSLDSARKGFLLGVSGNLEVLKVQDQLYQTKYDLAQAQLDYLLARLQLLASVGRLEAAAIDEIDDTFLDGPIALPGDRRHDNVSLAYSGK